MGNSASSAEKLFTAVQRNDVCAFQTLVADLDIPGMQPAARAEVLERKDKSGRTPLLVAASKNHYQILQQLLQLGANPHYINPSRDCAGGALHEAAARRHEAALEALLAAGACPFAANASGRTALDEAVLSGHTGVVRTIEKYAEFSGLVGFKIRKLGGLTSKYKARWVVLMPYFPFNAAAAPAAAAGGGGGRGPSPPGAPRPRRLLWVYKDKASVSPRCRLWVDGATVMTHGPAGTEGTLRLHTSHGEPVGDLATSYSQGYCVAMRPADLTPAAAAVYHRLVALLHDATPPHQHQQPTGSPLPALRPQPQLGGAVGPPTVIPQVPYYPQVLPAAGYGGGVGGAGSQILIPPPPPPPPAYSRPSSGAVPYPGAAGPSPMASPLSLSQQRQRQQSGTAACTPAAAAGVGGPPPGAEAGVGSGGRVIGEEFIEHLAAVPGESDEDFAARLASAISVTSGCSQQTLFPHQQQQQQQQQQTAAERPRTSPPPAPSASPPSHPSQQRQSATTVGQGPAGGRLTSGGSSSGGGGGGLINFHSDPGNGPGQGLPAAVATPAPAAIAAGGGGGASSVLRAGAGRGSVQPPPGQPPTVAGDSLGVDDLDMDAVNELIAAAAGGGGAAVAAEDTVPSAPPAVDPISVSPARLAPHRPPPASSPSSAADPDADLCIICLCGAKEVGLLHGDSVHRCVCRGCSGHIAVGSPCPLCRQRVERVLGVF